MRRWLASFSIRVVAGSTSRCPSRAKPAAGWTGRSPPPPVAARSTPSPWRAARPWGSTPTASAWCVTLRRSRWAYQGAGCWCSAPAGRSAAFWMRWLRENPASVRIANRTLAKAEALAERFDAKVAAAPLDGLDGRFDLIINGTSAGLAGDGSLIAPSFAVGGALLRPALRPRRTNALLPLGEAGRGGAGFRWPRHAGGAGRRRLRHLARMCAEHPQSRAVAADRNGGVEPNQADSRKLCRGRSGNRQEKSMASGYHGRRPAASGAVCRL